MNIDLDEIESRIADGIYGDDRLHRAARNDAFSALAEILAEVEHLRATVAALRASVPPVHPADSWHEAWTAALVDAKKEGARSAVEERAAERAAVVAWLRETLATSETAYASDDLDYAIAIIERGEHRREEGA
jgi:hypothetical protein